MHYAPGDRVFISGVYEVVHPSHRPSHQAWLWADDIFPRCGQCGRNVIYRFVRRASQSPCDHIRSDIDFQRWAVTDAAVETGTLLPSAPSTSCPARSFTTHWPRTSALRP